MEPDASGAPFDPQRDRVRLVSVDTGADRDDTPPEVRIVLAAGDRTVTGVRPGNRTGTAPLRPVVEATIEALGELFPRGPSLRLLAVDRILAAGMDVLLVALETPDVPGPSLVGAISVEDRDAARVGVLATLDAVNRVVGRGDETGG